MYYIFLIIMAGLMIWLGRESSMLRNTIFNEANFCKVAKHGKIKQPKPAYSLGRTQLAFWTVIVVSSFVYLLITQSVYPDIEVPVLDTVNLTLIGIAAGTTLVSKAIDISQNNNQGEAIPQQDYPSEGFFTDIISDEKGVSIHRLQNVIWTLVVGGIYIAYVSGHSTLPDDTILTPNLLTLMGISAGAYLGLKINENKNPVVNAAETNEAMQTQTVTVTTTPLTPAAPQQPAAPVTPIAPTDPAPPAPAPIVPPDTGSASTDDQSQTNS